MVIFHGDQVFVLEFKMAEGESDAEGDGATEEMLNRAMSQMRDRGYAEKYRDRGEPVHLAALVFGRTERNLLGVRAARA